MCAVAENLAPHRDLPVEPDLQKMLSTMRELVADTGGTVHFGRRNAENGEVCTDSELGRSVSRVCKWCADSVKVVLKRVKSVMGDL